MVITKRETIVYLKKKTKFALFNCFPLSFVTDYFVLFNIHFLFLRIRSLLIMKSFEYLSCHFKTTKPRLNRSIPYHPPSPKKKLHSKTAILDLSKPNLTSNSAKLSNLLTKNEKQIRNSSWPNPLSTCAKFHSIGISRNSVKTWWIPLRHLIYCGEVHGPCLNQAGCRDVHVLHNACLRYELFATKIQSHYSYVESTGRTLFSFLSSRPYQCYEQK